MQEQSQEKYIIYVRKSTDVEDKQVLSVEAQIVELRKFAADNNIKIAGVIIEKKSAKTPGRPKFNKMLQGISYIYLIKLCLSPSNFRLFGLRILAKVSLCCLWHLVKVSTM